MNPSSLHGWSEPIWSGFAPMWNVIAPWQRKCESGCTATGKAVTVLLRCLHTIKLPYSIWKWCEFVTWSGGGEPRANILSSFKLNWSKTHIFQFHYRLKYFAHLFGRYFGMRRTFIVKVFNFLIGCRPFVRYVGDFRVGESTIESNLEWYLRLFSRNWRRIQH